MKGWKMKEWKDSTESASDISEGRKPIEKWKGKVKSMPDVSEGTTTEKKIKFKTKGFNHFTASYF